MSTLLVVINEHTFRIQSGDVLTFGRDSECTVCLDAEDLGISRVAGRVVHHDESWWVQNLSRKRPLHLIGEDKVATPLPPTAPGWPMPWRPVDGSLAVLVAGERHTHRLLITPSGRAGRSQTAVPKNPVSTKAEAVPADPWQRAILVALAAGYLRRMPDYDPRPRTRSEVAEALGCDVPDVDRALLDRKEALHRAGVTDLDQDLDRKLCEWHLAMGHISEPDLRTVVWYSSDSTVNPVTTTQSQINDRIKQLTRRTARAVAVLLEPRLRERYGPDWLETINTKYRPLRRSDLSDSRFCLRVFTQDPAAHSIGTEECRQAALDMLKLAHQASHDRPSTVADLEQSRRLSAAVSHGLVAK